MHNPQSVPVWEYKDALGNKPIETKHYVCVMCGFKSTSRAQVITHLRKHPLDTQKRFNLDAILSYIPEEEEPKGSKKTMKLHCLSDPTV